MPFQSSTSLRRPATLLGKSLGISRQKSYHRQIDPRTSLYFAAVGTMLRRRRSCRKKRLSDEAVCMGWPKVPLHEASVLQTDLKIE
jgi:hypothetical protein